MQIKGISAIVTGGASGIGEACARQLAAAGAKVLIADVNDRPSDAIELASLCRRFRVPAHVNLIPLNPTPGYAVRGSAKSHVYAFADQLIELGANATVRRNRGTDIAAACGQLAAGQPVKLSSKTNVDDYGD